MYACGVEIAVKGFLFSDSTAVTDTEEEGESEEGEGCYACFRKRGMWLSAWVEEWKKKGNLKKKRDV